MDWLKPQTSQNKNLEKDKNKNTDFFKRDMPRPSIYPKGVPRSFLKHQGFQFPRTARNLTWHNPRFQTPTSSNPGETTGEISQDETREPPREVYSPSDIYDENVTTQSNESQDSEMVVDWSFNADETQTNVFDRLGPPKPKVPNLKINLQLDEPHTDRKVLVENIEESNKYTPVDQREDIQASKDPIVTEHLKSWPWSKKISEKKIINGRDFMSFTQREQEQLQETYDKPDTFVKVSITGYPTSWNKEDVLDAIIECVRGKTFIPCFIELSKEECKFLVLECRQALTTLHNYGFNIRKDNVDLAITISLTTVTLKTLDFVPKLILKKIMNAGYDGAGKMSLKEFTLKKDVSHFIYFPLNRINNQTQLINFASNITWEYIVELDLSHNRLTSIAGFDLIETTPKLRHLDLSHNLFEKLSLLVCCRDLPLESIHLEGNPVCNDYTDPAHYVDVIKTLYPSVRRIDGVSVPTKGHLPEFKRNYCSEEARNVAETVLEVYFPLLEVSRDQRPRIQCLYHEHAVLTITCKHKLRYSHMYRNFQDLLLRVRSLEDGRIDSIEGASTITKYINKWPELEYDPTTFTVDVMYHSDTITILRVTGLLKLIAATLAEDERLLAFTKTFVLKTVDGSEYRIINQMVYWDEPTDEFANSGFKLTTVSRKNLTLTLDSAPNEELKEKFIELFMKLTSVNRKTSERCLAKKNWHFKHALEYFVKLLKCNTLESLKEQ